MGNPTYTLEGDLYIPYYAHEAYDSRIGKKSIIDFLNDINTHGRNVKLTLEILPVEPKEDPPVYEEYHSYSNEELCREWNRLETLKLTPEIESRMDYIFEYLSTDRKVCAWNANGEVTFMYEND